MTRGVLERDMNSCYENLLSGFSKFRKQNLETLKLTKFIRALKIQ